MGFAYGLCFWNSLWCSLVDYPKHVRSKLRIEDGRMNRQLKVNRLCVPSLYRCITLVSISVNAQALSITPKAGVNTDHVRRVELLHDTPIAQSLSLFL